MDNFETFDKKNCEKLAIKSNFIAEGRFKVSAMSQRLISFCIYKMSAKSQDGFKTFQAEFEFKEFLSLLGMKRCSQKTLSLIKQATEECQKAFISYETNDKFVTMPWFQLCVVDKEKNRVSFTFNDSVGQAILDYSNGFIAEKLQLLGKLQSYYAMRWYDLTMTQKGQMGKNGNPGNQWFCQYSVKDIRAIFGIKKDEYSGRTDNFFRFVVERPIAELNAVNSRYTVEVRKVRKGKFISDIMLVCTETPAKLNEDSGETMLIENESAMLESCRSQYPQMWAEIEKDVVAELGESVEWTSQAFINGKIMKILSEKLSQKS